MRTLPKITFDSFVKNYTWIDKEDEDSIIQENWCYDYDLWDGPFDPDMRVRQEWVGKKVNDCNLCLNSWKYFKKPINGIYEI